MGSRLAYWTHANVNRRDVPTTTRDVPAATTALPGSDVGPDDLPDASMDRWIDGPDDGTPCGDGGLWTHAQRVGREVPSATPCLHGDRQPCRQPHGVNSLVNSVVNSFETKVNLSIVTCITVTVNTL